jgi:hypothetical protein
MSALTRQKKITFGEMRASGLRGIIPTPYFSR